MTHPRVGPVTALATEVFLGDPARFADGKAVISYVGLIPSEYSSGDRQRLGKITKQGNPLLRSLLCEARSMPCNEIRHYAGSIGASCNRKDLARRVSARLVSWGFVCGFAYAIKSPTK